MVLLNLRDRNLETVCNLGIHQITDVSSDVISNENELESLEQDSPNSSASCDTIYRAHKALMNLNQKNLKVFADVVSYLGQTNGE